MRSGPICGRACHPSKAPGPMPSNRSWRCEGAVAAALIAVLESDVTGPINIASGCCLPLRDVIGRIAKEIGRPELVRLGARPNSVSDPPGLAAVIHRLRDEVGFRPERSLDVSSKR
jgi:nucleoside-diphosphate-sugar epimerase